MLDITRVNHIGLRVKDLSISRAFYEKLGFQFIAGPSGPEPVAIVEHPSGVNINFILNADQGENDNILMDSEIKYAGYTHVALEISNAEAVVKQLKELGIELSGGPMKHPTGTSIFIRDPDRNVVEFIEYVGLNALRSQHA